MLLHTAAKSGSCEAVELLLDSNCGIDDIDNEVQDKMRLH